VSTQPVVQ